MIQTLLRNSLAVTLMLKPYDSAIPVLSIFLREMKHVSTQELVMSVHSSIIHDSQKWKQSKCPSNDEWLSKMQYILSGILLNKI